MERFFEACEARGFEVPEEYRKGWRDRIRDMPLAKLRLFVDQRPVAVDLFFVATPFQEAAMKRRREVRSSGKDSVAVISAADLVLFKLLAGRPKDLVDVRNVLAVQGVPDPEYLREQARGLRVLEQLERLIAETDPSP